MPTCDTTRWYLAQVKPNSHRIAERNLKRQGYKVFVPLHEETTRSRGRFTTTLKPLFPGYLFVAFDPERGLWHKISSTYGVARLVRFGSDPEPVPLNLITEIMKRCDTDGKFVAGQPFSAGDRVSPSKGPFSELIATVESLGPDERVWILLDMMGRQTRVAVGAEHLRLA